MDADQWTRWWFANRTAILQAEGRAARAAASTPGGAGRDDLWRIGAQRILARALSDTDEDVATGAAIALGKCADPSDAGALASLVLDHGRTRAVRESGALGLALIGAAEHPSSAAATRALQDVASSPDEPDRLRAMCAWALGLRHDAAAVPLLLDLAATGAVSWDVPAAATSALGMSGFDLVREPLEAWLTSTPAARRRDLVRRVHAAHALAHLGGAGPVPALRDAAGDESEDVRRAAALALGALAPAGDDETAALLARLLDRDRDRGVRNAAAIALGRMGPRTAAHALGRAYDRGDNLERPFAALALGMLVRGGADADVVARLRRDLEQSGSPDQRAAVAIALGLARDRTAARTLREIVASPRTESELRAHAALALGLIGDAAAADPLREILVSSADPTVRRETAMALGLLGDARSARPLAEMVRDTSNLYVQGAAAIALGRIGGPDASATLGTILDDRAQPNLARAFAAVGLGCVLDRSEDRGLGRVGQHLDWYLSTPSVEEILTIL